MSGHSGGHSSVIVLPPLSIQSPSMAIDGDWIDNGGNTITDECPPECPDINGDGIVNVNDLLMLIGNWGSSTNIGDVNFDGIVDVTDLLMVVGNWGPCE